MIEITASDIFWIGAMDKISFGLSFMGFVTVLLIYCSRNCDSVGLTLFLLFCGLAFLQLTFLLQALRLWQQ